MRPFPFLILPIAAAAKAHVSCQIPSAAGLSNTYDFSSLPQPVSLTHQLSTPPTTTTTHLRLILCGGEGDGLGLEEGVEETDQCPPQTTVCMRILNTKPNSEPEERTISVIPIAGSQIPGIDLPGQVTWAETPGICPDGKSDCMDLVGNFSGGEWNEERQKLTILMHCTTPADSLDAPTFLSYDANVLSLRWDTEHACPRSLDGEPDSPPGHPPKKSSFWGWFFFLFLLGPPIYLGLGIYHNRTTYDARGWDLIPHRQFWQDFPGLVQELLSYLMGNLRRSSSSRAGSSNRGGYESL